MNKYTAAIPIGRSHCRAGQGQACLSSFIVNQMDDPTDLVSPVKVQPLPCRSPCPLVNALWDRSAKGAKVRLSSNDCAKALRNFSSRQSRRIAREIRRRQAGDRDQSWWLVRRCPYWRGPIIGARPPEAAQRARTMRERPSRRCHGRPSAGSRVPATGT